LWTPGIAVGEPATINGYAYQINQAMPNIAPSATTMIFGDFSKFIVRRVASMSVRRLVERYAEFDQVGFLAFERVDSRLMDAGTHPLTHSTFCSNTVNKFAPALGKAGVL